MLYIHTKILIKNLRACYLEEVPLVSCKLKLVLHPLGHFFSLLRTHNIIMNNQSCHYSAVNQTRPFGYYPKQKSFDQWNPHWIISVHNNIFNSVLKSIEFCIYYIFIVKYIWKKKIRFFNSSELCFYST